MAQVVEKKKSPEQKPDSKGAKIARFALGSLFGILFLVICGAMFFAALRGPDTITMDGVNLKAGIVAGQQLPSRELKEGDIAPDFVLAQLGGNPIQLSKLRGKVVFVNFWATWCAPCRDEMKDIDRFYKANKNNDKVIVLTVNQKEDDSTIKGFFKDNGGITVPVVIDRDSGVAGAYFVTAYPESYFIDANGKIIAIKRAQITSKDIEDFYNKALASSKI